MFIGYFDCIVLGVLGILNAVYWYKRFNRKLGCLIIGLAFGIILPMISMKIEIVRVSNEFEIVDGFNLLYTYFRFPMYWIVGICQSILINVHDKPKKPAGNKS
ncbi:hypothetical protein ALGA_3528 [Labilibaculum antarcticum]|uniref:Uncharacterized protein n=2 Tax=Labilibaculum antarcticum TaxID=1717717 RepID=A0A1Y1CN29_9BACT|nr:hypothetical protein ALGA_3528 [Labilibaculum antarcticum]